MRRARGSLQARIALAVTAVVLVAVVALGTAVHLLVVRDRIDEARAAADDRVAAAMEIYRERGLLSFDATTGRDGVPAALLRAVRVDGDRATLVEGGGERRVWAAGRVGEEVLVVRERLDPVDASVRSVDRALLLAGAATVLLAGTAGLLVARRLSRRLRVAARTARDLSGGASHVSLRTAVGDRRDEVGDLADAVDSLAQRLALRVRAEQRFTADVAHDLRTPVAGLVTAAALLDDSRPAVLVRDRAHALRSLVEDLLEVARLDRGDEVAETVPTTLGEVVRRTVRRGVATGELAEDQVVVRLPDVEEPVTTDPRRLERVLSNLLRNALRHGAPPVEVVVDGHAVAVRDHGPGFEPAMLEQGPLTHRRRRAGADGHGLGLVIASGQVAVLGGELLLGRADGGGAVVTVRLP